MEEYKKLLVPIDGSELSKKALKKALSLGKAFKGEVTVLHVEEPIKGSYGAPGIEDRQPSEIEYLEMMRSESERILSVAKQTARESGMEIMAIHLRGHAANEIVNASKDYDLIVMGTHGRSGLKHLLLGSVAEKVARHACSPVLLIRERYAPCE